MNKLIDCMLCDLKTLDRRVIICPLLNDPILEVCLDCFNKEKIRQNEEAFKESIWNS